MFNLTITIQSRAPVDLASVSPLLDALDAVLPPMLQLGSATVLQQRAAAPVVVALPAEPAPAPKKAKSPAPPPSPAEPAKETATETPVAPSVAREVSNADQASPAPTIDEIRTLATAAVAKGKREGLAALLKKYLPDIPTPSLTSLTEAVRPAFKAELEKL